MFLKSIEIRGFKSFADKTDLSFIKGITAVVGPNGSGKSNISDAVRWVLGEQSIKSLRGGKMEDVIFAGTQFRKPVGLAQVSLTLDNSDGELPLDYSDVTVSRRLYRSGESEYYINNTHCRLKDIQELFMDTGIGKEGYSIIGQGKIDAILSGRPEERRNLLEEAAGIVKFKNRKEEASKKLENTEQNLLRIGDILRTYEERIEPLGLECEKAKKFLDLSEKLREKEVNLLIHSIEDIQLRINNINNNKDTIEKTILEDNLKKENLKFQLLAMNEKLERQELETKSKQEKFFQNKSEYQAISSETKLLEERIKNLYSNIEKDLEESNSLKLKIEELIILNKDYEVSLQQHHSEQKQITEEITSYEAEIINYNSSLNNQELEITKLKDDNIELLSKISEQKNQMLLLDNNKQQMERKIEELKNFYDNNINSLKINSNTAEMLQDTLVEISDKIEKYNLEIKNNKQEIIKLNSKLSEDEKRYKELSIAANKIEANHQMLLNLDKQYEGYNKSVKVLMQNISSGKIPKAISNSFVLGDIISVKKELEEAIEIALGGAISDIITTNEAIAKELIQYLKNNNIGRATFLPLNIIKGKSISNLDILVNQDGYIGVASSLIGYELKFRNAIEYLLGRTIIARDMDSALSLSKKTGYGYKIVTLSGEVINPGGSLTGGSIYHKSSSIIGRRREIEELSLKLEETNKDVNRTAKDIAELRESIKRLDDSCLNLKDQIYHENIEITKVQEKISTINSENDKLTRNLNFSKDEIKFLGEKVETLIAESAAKDLLLNEMTKKEQLNSLRLSELQLTIKEKSSKIAEFKEKHTSLKIKKAQIDEIVVGKIRELERITREMDEYRKKLSSIEKQVEGANNIILQSRSAIEGNKERLDFISVELLNFEELFKTYEVERISIKDSIKNTTNELEQLELLLGKREDEIHKIELSSAKFEAELESSYARLNDEMCLTYAEALKYKSAIESLENYKRSINQIKTEITSLGVVNVGAIEEYKEVKEKYTFMNAQKEDLIKAKNELLEMINDMTSKMKVLFSENLNKLRIIFNETFKELFKGGRADLILAEGDELTANIEINVEPPGKKLQNINLMSGGEKVLSAIALLFAILKMKPTPFCILDEIEAALDDANVLRYADFLRKFSGNVQFIVITHRKGTMEVSDVLYGVTMEEKGISKVVSVDLSKHPA